MIIKDSRTYLRNSIDRVLEMNIQQDLDEYTPFECGEYFDLVTMRAIINHCSDYVAAVENAKQLTTSNGLVVITLHIPLTEDPSRVLNHAGYPTDEPGNVIRHHINRLDFFDAVASRFEVVEFIRFRDKWKPNDVIVLRNVVNPTGTVPKAQDIQMRGFAWRVARAITPSFAKALVRRI